MIDYITVTKEEVADGEYRYSILAFDDHDCEVDDYGFASTIVGAYRFAESLAEKHGAVVEYDIASSDYNVLSRAQ